MVGLVLNNVFIMALHIVVGEKVLNTLSNHAMCTIAFGAILSVVYFFCTFLVYLLIQFLSLVLWLDYPPSAFSPLVYPPSLLKLVTMFISVLLGRIFSGVQSHPFGYPAYGTQIITSAWAPTGTTFVTGMSAMLNISYTLMSLP